MTNTIEKKPTTVVRTVLVPAKNIALTKTTVITRRMDPITDARTTVRARTNEVEYPIKLVTPSNPPYGAYAFTL